MNEFEQIIGGGMYLFFTILGIEYILLYSSSPIWLIPYLLTIIPVYWAVFIKTFNFSKKKNS